MSVHSHARGHMIRVCCEVHPVCWLHAWLKADAQWPCGQDVQEGPPGGCTYSKQVVSTPGERCGLHNPGMTTAVVCLLSVGPQTQHNIDRVQVIQHWASRSVMHDCTWHYKEEPHPSQDILVTLSWSTLGNPWCMIVLSITRMNTTLLKTYWSPSPEVHWGILDAWLYLSLQGWTPPFSGHSGQPLLKCIGASVTSWRVNLSA